MKLKFEELVSLNGGGFSWGLAFGAAVTLVIFAAGVIDGWINPKKCND